MSVARSTGALVGTSESSLQSISSGVTFSGSEVDLLGDNTSVGEAWLYAVITATEISNVQLKFNNRRVTGQAYSKSSFDIKVATINGTVKVPLGKRPVGRFLQVDAKNNGSATMTVSVLYELEKVS